MIKINVSIQKDDYKRSASNCYKRRQNEDHMYVYCVKHIVSLYFRHTVVSRDAKKEMTLYENCCK